MSKLNKENRVVLAYGETTGHAHAFYGEDTVEYIKQDAGGGTLKIKASDALQHEEHTKQDFDIGVGKVRIQREYVENDIRILLD